MAALLVVHPVPALAHGGDPTVVTELTGITPPLPDGVVVQVRTTVSEQMLIANPTGKRLAVLDPNGDPFLRVSRSGAFGNVANPYFHRTLNPPDVPPRIPRTARTGADPRWLRLAEHPSWGWFEPRVHPFEPGTRSGTGVLASWRVGMRYGSEPVTVTGTLERRPVAGRFIARTDPPPEGLEVSVAQGPTPALLLVAPPERAVVVVGTDGRDFLRMDARGVFANTASAAFRHNPTFVTRTGGQKGWVRVGAPGRITWQDPRLSYRSDRPPEVVVRAERAADLGRWEIPLRIDGTPTALRGTVSWVPAGTPLGFGDGGSGPPWVALGGGVAFAVAIGAVVVAARRRRHGVAAG